MAGDLVFGEGFRHDVREIERRVVCFLGQTINRCEDVKDVVRAREGGLFRGRV